MIHGINVTVTNLSFDEAQSFARNTTTFRPFVCIKFTDRFKRYGIVRIFEESQAKPVIKCFLGGQEEEIYDASVFFKAVKEL